ncbi:DUF6233 domain-containing protein [Streptomyces sp. NBC_01443]|uniref:DUF6233 domain-containing protein n=1 Tax=Streptomyces sp. NBC_01443 TaxID=2903868 RepID=UPI00338F2703
MQRPAAESGRTASARTRSSVPTLGGHLPSHRLEPGWGVDIGSQRVPPPAKKPCHQHTLLPRPSRRTAKPVTTRPGRATLETRRALAEGVPSCPHCRPDAALGVLE